MSYAGFCNLNRSGWVMLNKNIWLASNLFIFVSLEDKVQCGAKEI